MNVRPSAIIIRDAAVLTLRYCYSGQEVFGLPGGNPDPGETLAETLRREIQEELLVEVETGKMVFCGEVIWPEIKKETLHIVFEAKLLSGEPELNPQETTALEIVWLPVAELAGRLLYPNIGTQIADYYRNRLQTPYCGPINQPYLP